MIGIIGAGISGLVLAYELEKEKKDYVLLEASDLPGGNIKTEIFKDYILEKGPNSILCNDELLAYFHELGLGNEILHAAEVSKARYILKEGIPQEIPTSPPKLLSSSFFSWSTKMKIMAEPFKSKKPTEEETIKEFIEYRFGKEVENYAVNPFVSGTFAGDPAQLLLKETFPFIPEIIKKQGSLLKGLQKNPPKRRATITFRQGMKSLPEALASKLSAIRFHSKITEIIKNAEGFALKINAEKDYLQLSALVLSLPAFGAAPLLQQTYPSFAAALKEVYYPPMVVAHSGYDSVIVKHSLNGFGVLHPKIEDRFMAGTIWTSSVFPHRTPSNDKVLFTNFVGGTQYVDNANKDESFIRNSVTSELRRIYNIKGDPCMQRLHKWEKSIPQYDQKIIPVNKMVKELEKENLYVCASWQGGISVSDCINKARSLAKEL